MSVVHIREAIKQVMSGLAGMSQERDGRAILADIRKQIRARGIHRGKAIPKRQERERRVERHICEG